MSAQPTTKTNKNSKNQRRNDRKGHKSTKSKFMNSSNNNDSNDIDVGVIENSFERMAISSKNKSSKTTISEVIQLPREIQRGNGNYKDLIKTNVLKNLLQQKTTKKDDGKENDNQNSGYYEVHVEGLILTMSGPAKAQFYFRNAADKIRESLQVEGGLRWLKGELGWEWSSRLETSSSRKKYLDALNKLQDVFAKLAPQDIQRKFPRDKECKKLIWVKESDLASSVASIRSFLELLFYLDDVSKTKQQQQSNNNENNHGGFNSSDYPRTLIKNIQNPQKRWNYIMKQVRKLMRTGMPDAPVHFSVHHQNNRYPLSVVTPEAMDELVGRLVVIMKNVFLGYPPKKETTAMNATYNNCFLEGVGTAWIRSGKRESDWKHSENDDNNKISSNDDGNNDKHIKQQSKSNSNCSHGTLEGFESPASLQKLLNLP